MHSQRFVISALITGLLVALAGAADAATFAVTAKNRQFCCTNTGFIAGQPAKAGGYQSVNKGYVVDQFGTGTPSIKIGANEAINFYSKFSWVKGGMTSPPPGFKYIKGTVDLMNGAGTLKKGGGYGNFSFCPKAKGPGVGACTAPSKATPASFNGRIAIKQGPNKFGGTLQVLGSGTKNKIWRWIGASSMYPAALLPFKLYSSIVGAMTPAKLKQISGLMTMLVTHTAGSKLVTILNITNGMLSANGAGPFTTGMAYIGVTKNGSPPTRTITTGGYDKRTAMGAGNVQLVSGHVFNTFANIKAGSFPIGWKVRLPEPSPSLGLAAGALGLLVLAGVTRARGRR